ncbi:MAG: hypothetical protein ABJF23_32135 [Bryobacteraceae bacterium]
MQRFGRQLPCRKFPGIGVEPTTPEESYVNKASPAAAGLTIVPIITIGGVAAPYLSGAPSPEFAGLYQIAVRVPDLPDGDQEVTLRSGGMISPAGLYLSVRH